MEFLPPQTQNVLCNPHKNPAIGQNNSADGGGAAQAADRGIQKAEGKRMALNKVDLCGVDTSKLPVLTNAQMQALFARIAAGDKSARDEFVGGNLRLVLSVVQRFAGRGEMMDDLFQVGCIGLMKSIDNFDTTLGVRFSTYAVPMIIGEIRRYLRDNNAIRVSRSLRDIAYKAMQAREKLSVDLGRDPTVAEIAKALDAKEEDVVLALDAIQEPMSLNEPIYHDNGDALYVMDQIRDERGGEEEWTRNIALKNAMDHLNERERKIVQMRFFGGRTQMEVAEEIGISQAQVSRLEKTALAHMKKYV